MTSSASPSPTERSSSLGWLMAAAAYAALTLAYVWPLLGSFGTALPSDTGDPALNAWILWWNAHAVPLTEAWWNAPIFYPAKGAFAFSETMLGLAPLTTPLMWSGASAVVTYNVAFVLSFFAAAMSAHALAKYLTGRHDAAFLAGLAFGFSPYRAAQMPHLQVLWSCWMPLALLFLHKYLDRRRARDLALAGLCWVLNGLTNGYFLVFFAVIAGLWVLWFAPKLSVIVRMGLALGLASVLLVPVIHGYMKYQGALGLSRDGGEIGDFSADVTSIWATSGNLGWPRLWTIEPRAEGELYPGVTILALVVVAGFLAWRRTRAGLHLTQRVLGIAGLVVIGVVFLTTNLGGWTADVAGAVISITRPAKGVFVGVLLLGVAILLDRRLAAAWRRRSRLLFYAGAAAIAFVLAWGPTGKVAGSAFFYQAPYSWLMALPGGHSLRVPPRFAMLMVMCLGQAAALAFARLTPRGAPRALVAVLALGVVVDGWVPKLPTATTPRVDDLTRGRVAKPLLELPMNDLYSDTGAMLRATTHGHPLFNGFSGYSPPHYDALQGGMQVRDASVLDALRTLGDYLVFLDRAGDGDGRIKEFLDTYPGATRVGESRSGALYEVAAAKSAGAVPDAGAFMPPASISTNWGFQDVALMSDNDLTTRWQTPTHQAPGDEIRLEMGRPITVTRIELDIAAFKSDFPRRLRVAVVVGQDPPRTVWEGGTAGLAVLGAMKDYVRLPIVVELPPGTVGQQIILSVVEGHPDFSWSVAELKVYGK